MQNESTATCRTAIDRLSPLHSRGAACGRTPTHRVASATHRVAIAARAMPVSCTSTLPTNLDALGPQFGQLPAISRCISMCVSGDRGATSVIALRICPLSGHVLHGGLLGSIPLVHGVLVSSGARRHNNQNDPVLPRLSFSSRVEHEPAFTPRRL